jgi:hypothetical protein
MKDYHTCVPPLAGPGRAMAVAVARGRGKSDLGPNIPLKWLCILTGVVIVRFLSFGW